MIKKTSTALKAIFAAIVLTSFIAISCNNEKTSGTDAGTTDTGAGHPVTPVNRTGSDTDTAAGHPTNAKPDTDTGAAHPVTPVNKDATPPPPPPSN
jgi:hypothetical protein